MGPPRLFTPSPDPPMPTPPPFSVFSLLLTRPISELGTALVLGTQQLLEIEILIYKILDVDKACLQLVLTVIRSGNPSQTSTSNALCSPCVGLSTSDRVLHAACHRRGASIPGFPKRFPGASLVRPEW